MFEKLEDFWDWAVSFLRPVDKQVEIMRGWRHDGVFGIDIGGWGHVFFLYGLLMRLITLLPSLYSHRNGLRMNLINPQISEITQNQNKAKNDRTLSTAEKRVIKDGYTRMKHALMKKHGCAQWKSMLAMLTAPVTMSAFFSIRRLAMYETDLEMAPFLWVHDLTMPDPTYILPAICAGMFLLNFEMNQRMQKGGRSASSMYIRWAVRGGAVVGIYFFAAQPSAMFAYWIGLSTAGLLQPILLRWQPFRDYFGFPDPPQLAKVEILSEIKGPSLYERLFASQEEKARLEEERKAKRLAQAKKKFETINDFEVVLDDQDPKK
ncbi:preprotein translocase subunit YidC [Strigomonas culicis]|nr:preprotein translocase subunit YidC [Strigomonas culicis]|eukprot:EPY33240.1 preprotein translocase subunit YidC [Strigomonas culicis]